MGGQARLGASPAELGVPIAFRWTESSYAEWMDLEVAVTFGVILVGGFALGMLLNVLRPPDEAAATARHPARPALVWLPHRFRSNQIRMQPKPGSAPHG